MTMRLAARCVTAGRSPDLRSSRKRNAWIQAIIAVTILAAYWVLLSGYVAAAVHAAAFQYAAAQYPEPTGNINDYVGVLSRQDRVRLEALVDEVLKKTGATFAVAIVPDHGDESLEIYSVKLYEKWGIGQKGEDRGLLVVVSMKERDLRMEVGYGLEGVINDARAGECLDLMIPYFKRGEYGAGLYAGLWRAAQYVAADSGARLDENPPPAVRSPTEYVHTSVPWQYILLGLGIPLLAIGAMLARGNRCPRCRSRLTVTERIVQHATYDASGIAVRIYHCPRCGYHSERSYTIGRLTRPPGGGIPPIGPGPFFGGGFGTGSGGGLPGPRGFGGGRSGGGGASRKW